MRACLPCLGFAVAILGIPHVYAEQPINSGTNEEIELTLKYNEDELSGNKGQQRLLLTVRRKPPSDSRLNFWMGLHFILLTEDGTEVPWSIYGSDWGQVPPPPDAFPQLKSGRAAIEIQIILGETEKIPKRPYMLVQTEWGMVWSLSGDRPTPLYLKAMYKGNKPIGDENPMIRRWIEQSIGVKGFDAILEGPLSSNALKLRLDGSNQPTENEESGYSVQDGKKPRQNSDPILRPSP
jgi:hypothetical protein